MKYIVLFCVGFLMIAATSFTLGSNKLIAASSIDTIPNTNPKADSILEIPKKETKENETNNNKIITGIASFYSDYFDGRKTATGEVFRQSGMTCASNNIALGNWVKVTNIRNNKSVIVKVNDRMAPSMAKKGRVVDLTRTAASKLDFISAGLTKVKVEVLGKKKP